MFSLVYVEIKPVWVTVKSEPYLHQKSEAHRWPLSNAEHGQIERLVEQLRSIGTVSEKLHGYPASITVVPTSTVRVVERIEEILKEVFPR